MRIISVIPAKNIEPVKNKVNVYVSVCFLVLGIKPQNLTMCMLPLSCVPSPVFESNNQISPLEIYCSCMARVRNS